MKSFLSPDCWGISPGNKQKSLSFLISCIVWAVALLAASWLIRYDVVPTPYSWFLALLPTLIGIYCAIQFYQLLIHSDELYRKIQLEGLAIGFATGIVFGSGYGLLARLGLPAMDLTTLVAIMCFGWIAGQITAAARYQ